MKYLHFDLIGGASGDMVLGVFADLGVDMTDLAARLASMGLGKIELIAERCVDHGISGTRVIVKVNGREADFHHEHHHRRLGDIKKILDDSDLPDVVKENSVRIFRRLAEAEAVVHGVAPEEIHFHEVGAVDSIIDITGACMCLYMQKIAGVSLGVFPLGSGTTTCAHGTLPVPVPAVVELLKGFEVRQTDEPFELVTPTGAALLTGWKNLNEAPAGCRVGKAGYGLGRRKLNHTPNALRAMELNDESGQEPDVCSVMECNIDDMIPELVSELMDELLKQGAKDVFLTPVQMKKQRPGILLTVICDESGKAALLDIIFRESTTFGVREYTARRTLLNRRHELVKTPSGTIRIKVGSRNGDDITFTPEYDDCVKLARLSSQSVRNVYNSAVAEAVKHNFIVSK